MYNVFFTGNHCISFGHKLEVQFYGKTRLLQVTSITGPYDSTRNLIPSSQSKDKSASYDRTMNLSNKLAALQLDNKSTNNVQPGNDQEDICTGSCKALTFSTQPNDSESGHKEHESFEQVTGLKKPTLLPSVSQINSDRQSQNCLESLRKSGSAVFYYISPEETQLIILTQGSHQSKDNKSKRKVTFDSIGGLKKQVGIVREMIELPLQHPELFTNYGKFYCTVEPLHNGHFGDTGKWPL